MAKCSKTRYIVFLLYILRRWKARVWEWSSRSLVAGPSDVPQGHVAINVGSSNRRFVVRATHLNHPSFRKLLLQAEEEYGFSNPGPLSLPCEESLFFQILRQISSSYVSPISSAIDFEDRVAGFYSSYRSGGEGSWRATTVPLLSGNAEEEVY